MSREIRRVPLDWEHPRYTEDNCPWWLRDHRLGDYMPLNDEPYVDAVREYLQAYDLWIAGQHPSQAGADPHDLHSLNEYIISPPDPAYYREREWTDAEATAYQIYETVSEGSPVSPVFPTQATMRAWLLTQGYSERAADGFIQAGSVLSGMAIVDDTGARYYSGIEIGELLYKDTP